MEPNRPANRSSRWWIAPFLGGFVVIFAAAFGTLPDLSSEWLSTLLISFGTILAVALVVFLSRKHSPAAIEITRPAVEW